MKSSFSRVRVWMSLALGVCAAGCATIRITEPPRTATEQFLINQATSSAVAQLTGASLRDRKVYVDSQFLADTRLSNDQSYLVGDVRAKLLMEGVRLVNKRDEAQIVLELRAQSLGIDRADNLIGIPAITLPGAGVESVATPEIAIFKSTRQKGFTSVAFVAYWQDTGEVVASSGPFVGKTYRNDSWILGWGPLTAGDIPPAQKGK